MKKDKFEKKCDKCGKVFFMPHSYELWAYKAVKNGHLKLYCSWTCLIHRNDKNEMDAAATTDDIVNGSN